MRVLALIDPVLRNLFGQAGAPIAYAMGAALLYGVVFSLGARRLSWSSILIAVPFLL